MQRYTVQCVADYAQAQTQTQESLLPVTANTAVCFTIAILLVLHLLNTLVVTPLVNNPIVGKGKTGFLSDVHLYAAIQIH